MSKTKNQRLADQATITETPTPRRMVRSVATYWLGAGSQDVEEPVGVSETIPDQSMSLTELLHRYSRGLPINSQHPTYSEEDFSELDKLDYFDKVELSEQTAAKIKQMRADLERMQKETEEANAAKPAAAGSGQPPAANPEPPKPTT